MNIYKYIYVCIKYLQLLLKFSLFGFVDDLYSEKKKFLLIRYRKMINRGWINLQIDNEIIKVLNDKGLINIYYV